MLTLKPVAKDERRWRAVAPIARKPIAKRPRAAAAADAASGGGAAPDDAEAADEGEAARRTEAQADESARCRAGEEKILLRTRSSRGSSQSLRCIT